MWIIVVMYFFILSVHITYSRYCVPVYIPNPRLGYIYWYQSINNLFSQVSEHQPICSVNLRKIIGFTKKLHELIVRMNQLFDTIQS